MHQKTTCQRHGHARRRLGYEGLGISICFCEFLYDIVHVYAERRFGDAAEPEQRIYSSLGGMWWYVQSFGGFKLFQSSIRYQE